MDQAFLIAEARQFLLWVCIIYLTGTLGRLAIDFVLNVWFKIDTKRPNRTSVDYFFFLISLAYIIAYWI